MARTILVMHPGALGDVLLAIPAIQQLRAHIPGCTIACAVQESIGSFLLRCGVIDVWMSIEGPEIADLFAGSVSCGSRLDELLRQCDVCVIWLKDEHQAIRRVLERYGVRQISIRSPFDEGLQARHQRDRFMEIIGETGLPPCETTRWKLPAEIVQLGRECLLRHGLCPEHPLVMIHPGSGSRLKCIKPNVLADTIMQLQTDGLQCCVLEGPADQETAESLARCVQRPISVIKGMDISTVAGILSHTTLYIGHDSGVTHLSGLIGVQTLAMFGPTNPEQWAPKGPHVKVVRGMPCICLSWEEVRRCKEKPCLAIQSNQLLDVCRSIEEMANSSL